MWRAGGWAQRAPDGSRTGLVLRVSVPDSCNSAKCASDDNGTSGPRRFDALAHRSMARRSLPVSVRERSPGCQSSPRTTLTAIARAVQRPIDQPLGMR